MSRSPSSLPSPVSNRVLTPRPGLARCLADLAPKLVALAAAVCLLLVSSAALAGGNIILKTPKPDEEEGGRWTLLFDIDYGRVPDMPHVPMMFTFQHVTQYEWALTDQSPDKPVMNRKPLQNQTEINLPQDVGFADAAGKVWKMTKAYKLVLRRNDGQFEAGEYTLTVRQEGAGPIGRQMRIVLGGKNEPVDRREINIQAARPPKKDPEKKDSPASDKGKDGEAAPDEFANLPSGDVEPEAEGPPAEKPRQGGCGCRIVGTDAHHREPGSMLAALLLGSLAVATVRRSRRRR
jgi:hypothetical protein